MLAAQPVGHSAQMLPGAVSSDSPGAALGPGTGSGGDGDGAAAGDGSGSRGFGDGLKLGGPGVTTPVVVLRVTPQYTTDAMRAKVQGVVWLECIVLSDGTVGDVRITRSLDSRFGLDDAAIVAARQWRFKPGLLNGQPVPVAVTIELTFTLR
jgi:protein TonB